MATVPGTAVKAPGGGAPLSIDAGSPLPHSAAFPTPLLPQMGFTPSPAHETDLLVYDIYSKVGFPLAALETQVRAIRIPHVSWAPSFLHMDGSPSVGINRLRVCALLKDSGDSTVLRVEQVSVTVLLPTPHRPPLTPAHTARAFDFLTPGPRKHSVGEPQGRIQCGFSGLYQIVLNCVNLYHTPLKNY